MDKLRLFVAIDIDREGIDKIIPLQKHLAEVLKDVRWTKEDTWHITIKFLGEVKASLLDKIAHCLNEIKNNFSAFTLELDKLDFFPDARIPRVIFLGLKECLELKKLAGEIENKLAEIGFPKEKREFHGHLTLGRIKDTKKFLQSNPKYRDMQVPSIQYSFDVKEFHLYKSELKKDGPSYTRLFSFNLKS
ncbi:MAG: RNA 2',3'-cyclic phosphodiesterase [Proteobacteria bacterium]|nr:RNA 2',3'-cyclic phosphodiesterase [Pseudomonadota bacterium]